MGHVLGATYMDIALGSYYSCTRLTRNQKVIILQVLIPAPCSQLAHVSILRHLSEFTFKSPELDTLHGICHFYN